MSTWRGLVFECSDAAAIRVSSVVALVISTAIRVFTVRAVFSLVVGHTVGLTWSLIDCCLLGRLIGTDDGGQEVGKREGNW